MPELMVLIKGMVTAMKSVFYVLCLTLMIAYILAIAICQLSDGYDFQVTYFSTVPLGMYWLFISVAFFDNMGQFCEAVRRESTVCFMLVGAFVFLVSLTTLNMLIGVLCEVVSSVAQAEGEERRMGTIVDTIQFVMQEIDTDVNGKISYAEFCQILESQEALKSLQSLGIDPVGIIDLAEVMFFVDGVAVELDFNAFIEMLFDLRECKAATVKDMKMIWRQACTKIHIISQCMEDMKRLIAADAGRYFG